MCTVIQGLLEENLKTLPITVAKLHNVRSCTLLRDPNYAENCSRTASFGKRDLFNILPVLAQAN